MSNNNYRHKQFIYPAICLLVLFCMFTDVNISYAKQIRIVPLLSDTSPLANKQLMFQKQLQGSLPETARKNNKTEQSPITAQTPALVIPSKKTLSEFEKFMAGKTSTAISTDIRQFGYDLFRQPASSFSPDVNVPVGPGYVLGPGDEIRISVWGKVEGMWNVVIDRDGNISLPKVGVIGITGLTFSKVKSLLHKEFSKYYTGFEMNVSMGALKTVRVYLVGNTLRPGAYTISSLSTLVNALFEAGGPSKTGTLRDIQLKRNGETVQHFDLYDFLLRGDKSKDMRLLPEDVIFIPPVGPLAGIAGNVRSPAIYELNSETRLLDLINMAGGLTGVAFKGRVQWQRIENHQYRTLFEGDLINLESDDEKNFVLKDGDLVKIFTVVETKNTITLSGAVANQDDYGIAPGVTKLSDVISKAGGLLYYASEDAELTRVKATQSGPETSYIRINISKALSGDAEHNIPLEINDYILVKSIPEWTLYNKATINGEVKYPGIYTIRKGEKLSSLIERAGGYTDNAYLRAAVFTREDVREMQQNSMDAMVERLERELLIEGSAQLATALSTEEVQAKKVELEQQQKFIGSLKNLKATGRMSIRLAHLRLLKNSEYDIELKEGDTLNIPTKKSVVNVVGSVMSRGSFIYSGKLTYKHYIEMAGGFTKYADKKSVYVMKIDGTAIKLSKGLASWNSPRSRWELEGFGDNITALEAGDSIIIPEKLDRIAWLREVKDITQILFQIATTAGVMVLLF
ncbi:MAG: SLBB domain-containing protein [Nitrospirota bacterium]